MKVTLRTFLGITGNGFLEPYAANLYVDEWDELFEEWQPKKGNRQHETCIRTRAVS